jgi:hypothetical protein
MLAKSLVFLTCEIRAMVIENRDVAISESVLKEQEEHHPA